MSKTITKEALEIAKGLLSETLILAAAVVEQDAEISRHAATITDMVEAAGLDPSNADVVGQSKDLRKRLNQVIEDRVIDLQSLKAMASAAGATATMAYCDRELTALKEEHKDA